MEEIGSGLIVNDSTMSYTDTGAFRKMVTILNCIMFGAVCQAIVVFGIGTNIINIIWFVEQGFKDHINISLSGMAISDLLSLTPLLWTNVCVCLASTTMNLTFDPIDVQHMVTALPHTVFTRLTAWITAFVTLERCLCIAVPLKVKSLITSRRVSVVLVSIFIILVACQTPYYIANRLDWKYFPLINKSLIAIVSNYNSVDNISYIINNVILNLCAFIVIIVCTLTLSIQLHYQTKWRMTSTTATILSKQNKTLAKLVVVVSIIFIGCFSPNCILFILMSLSPEFTVEGKYKDIIFMIGAMGIILESINSSVNIFVYYHMSTKYRVTFRRVFTNNKK